MDRIDQTQGVALAALWTSLALLETLEQRGILGERGFADVMDAALELGESSLLDRSGEAASPDGPAAMAARFARSILEDQLRAAGPPVSEPYPAELSERGPGARQHGWLRRLAQILFARW